MLYNEVIFEGGIIMEQLVIINDILIAVHPFMMCVGFVTVAFVVWFLKLEIEQELDAMET